MKLKIKAIMRVCAFLLAASLLAGCGGGGDSASGSSDGKSSSAKSSKATSSASASGAGDTSSDAVSDGSSSDSASNDGTSSVQHSSSAAASSKADSGNKSSMSVLPNYTRDSMKEFGHNGNTKSQYPVYAGKRDPWLWPFARDSIWNTPIGSNAVYKAAGLEKAPKYSCDYEHLLTTTTNDDYVALYDTPKGHRWPTDVSGLKVRARFYFPKGYTVSKSSTDNNCSAILQPDGRYYNELEPTCRDDANAMYVTGYNRLNQDIYGEGRLGSHWGSGLSTLGGSIRVGELLNSEPIHHALKINVYAKKYIYYDIAYQKGYRWPADRHDAYARNVYGGTDPELRMGSLLALPKDSTPESIGIKTEVGKKLFYALRDYGCYIVDDSAQDCYSIDADIQTMKELKRETGINLNMVVSMSDTTIQRNFTKDFMALITNLMIITNNDSKNIGGGGTPRAPLAPDLPSVK